MKKLRIFLTYRTQLTHLVWVRHW